MNGFRNNYITAQIALYAVLYYSAHVITSTIDYTSREQNSQNLIKSEFEAPLKKSITKTKKI